MTKILFKILLSGITAIIIMLGIFAFLNKLFGLETLIKARAGIFFIILFPFLSVAIYRLILYSGELKNKIQKLKKKTAVFIKNAVLKINGPAEKITSKILRISIPDKFIEDFIKKSLSDGLPEIQIIGRLSAAGCGKEKIAAAFSKIEGKIKNIKLEKEEKSLNREQTFLIEIKKLKGTRITDLARLALRIFKVKPTRSVLTILGIGVSFGVILFLVALGYGLQNHLLRQISSAESLLTLDVLSPNPDALTINNETVEQFSRIPNVLKVSPVAIVNGQLNLNGISYEVLFTGVSPSFKESSALNMVSGEFFKTDENEIVVSSFFLKLFNKSPNELLNNETYLTFFIPRKNAIEEKSESENSVKTFKENSPFKITGVVEDETNNFIYTPFPALEKLNLPSYGSVKIKVADSASLEETRSKILEMGFSVSTVSDTVEQANKIFNALQIVLALFGIAALIVAVIGMINTMTIALLERIQEIGIMKVIGASDRDVEKLFLLESVVIGFLGGISGLLIGFISSQLFNIGVNALANALGGNKVDLFYYPLWFIIVIVVFSSLVGILTGALPARKAGKMDPLQALRYK